MIKKELNKYGDNKYSLSVYSAQIGYEKPNKEIFKYALDNSHYADIIKRKNVVKLNTDDNDK